jgi:hypothetical protein
MAFMRQSFHRNRPVANTESPHPQAVSDGYPRWPRRADYSCFCAYIGCALQPNRSQYLLVFALLAAGILGCAADTITLNSERIARKFGNYGLELIENTDNIRVSNLYSMEANGRVCRTFAVVGISREIDPSFAAEHAQILEGASIGAVFKRNGWSIQKHHQYIGEMTIGMQATRLARVMRLKPPATVAVHNYMLTVSKDGSAFDYAIITEVHHPDYLTISTLWAIYGSEFSGDNNRKDTQQILELVRSKFRDSMYSG